MGENCRSTEALRLDHPMGDPHCNRDSTRRRLALLLSPLFVIAAGFSSCAMDDFAQVGVVAGAAVGWAAGQQSGNAQKGAAIGAATGGVIGMFLNQNADQRRKSYASDADYLEARLAEAKQVIADEELVLEAIERDEQALAKELALLDKGKQGLAQSGTAAKELRKRMLSHRDALQQHAQAIQAVIASLQEDLESIASEQATTRKGLRSLEQQIERLEAQYASLLRHGQKASTQVAQLDRLQ